MGRQAGRGRRAVSTWEERMAEKHQAKRDRAAAEKIREVEAARRAYLGEVFLPFYPPDDGVLKYGWEPEVEVLPEVIAANCLGITEGDPGPKEPGDYCRECWGERYVWLGNCWGHEHAGDGIGRGCQHECHEGEVWLACVSEDAFRIFIAGPRETQVVEAPPGVEEAYDLMTADGVPPEQAADMATAAHQAGKDPAAFARHFTGLRQGMRRGFS